jgi:ABC-type branched-subunit amino acid transport system permease subunit
VSFWFGERDALLNVIAGTGSLLGLIIGALIAIPITYLVTPTVSGGEPNLNVEEKK